MGEGNYKTNREFYLILSYNLEGLGHHRQPNIIIAISSVELNVASPYFYYLRGTFNGNSPCTSEEQNNLKSN